MNERMNIAVIGANESQYEKICISLNRHKLTLVPVDEGSVEVADISDTTTVMLVFPGKTQNETLTICSQLRTPLKMTAIPLLLIVKGYDISHAFVTRQTENAGIIIEPFSEEELRESIEQLAMETYTTGP